MASRPPGEIQSEAAKRVEEGYREIVVTGVLVGAYGQDLPSPSMDLADLLLMLARVPGVARVRLSSIEPTQVTDRLLDAFAAEPRLCRHLHIPLQSGDSAVLRAMNRPYDQEFYLDRCRVAYARIPDLALTTDILVGFPGEDRAAFVRTLDVVRATGYARAHIFRYSPRPNTPAASLKQLPDAEKEARSHELAAVCREVQRHFIGRHLGRTMDVLVEGKESLRGPADGDAGGPEEPPAGGGFAGPGSSGGLLSGYTSNYIRVQFTGGSGLVGRIVPVHLLEPSADGAIGTAGGDHFAPLEAPPDADFLPLAVFSATASL
jgi:threonylcarbamoyladenosine tRNA methylthiotransferase MtaB